MLRTSAKPLRTGAINAHSLSDRGKYCMLGLDRIALHHLPLGRDA